MKSSRLHYLDNLKILLIFMVIMHHVGQGYGPSGGWWFYLSSQPDKLEWMGRFFCVNASFFMGLFFMISGFFFAGSFDKKGFKQYTLDKLVRYGIPLLFVYWILMPPIFYFNHQLYTNNPSLSFLAFFKQIYLGIGAQPEWYQSTLTWPLRQLGFGHFWFVENLLLYALLYGLFRVVFQKTSPVKPFHLNVYMFTFEFIILVLVATVLVRDYHKVGDIKTISGFLMIEVAHWPQYLGFLLAGILASQTNLFQKFPVRYGKMLLVLGLLMASTIYFPSLYPKALHSWSGKFFEVFETLMGFSLSFGLIVLFREYLNTTNRFISVLAENAYAAYLFHYPIVIAIQYGFDKVPLAALPKFLIVGILSITVTFAFSYMVRIHRLIRRVI